jgi:hypothetical protein
VKRILAVAFYVGFILLVALFPAAGPAGPAGHGYVRVHSEKAGWQAGEIIAVSAELSAFLAADPSVRNVVSPQNARFFLSQEYINLAALYPNPEINDEDRGLLRAELWRSQIDPLEQGSFLTQFELAPGAGLREQRDLSEKLRRFLGALESKHPGIEIRFFGELADRASTQAARMRRRLPVIVLALIAFIFRAFRRKNRRAQAAGFALLFGLSSVAVARVHCAETDRRVDSVDVFLRPKYWDVLDPDNMAALGARVEKISQLAGVERVASLPGLSAELIDQIAIRQPGAGERVRKAVLGTLEDYGALRDFESKDGRETKIVAFLRPGADSAPLFEGLKSLAASDPDGITMKFAPVVAPGGGLGSRALATLLLAVTLLAAAGTSLAARRRR